MRIKNTVSKESISTKVEFRSGINNWFKSKLKGKDLILAILKESVPEYFLDGISTHDSEIITHPPLSGNRVDLRQFFFDDKMVLNVALALYKDNIGDLLNKSGRVLGKDTREVLKEYVSKIDMGSIRGTKGVIIVATLAPFLNVEKNKSGYSATYDKNVIDTIKNRPNEKYVFEIVVESLFRNLPVYDIMSKKGGYTSFGYSRNPEVEWSILQAYLFDPTLDRVSKAVKEFKIFNDYLRYKQKEVRDAAILVSRALGWENRLSRIQEEDSTYSRDFEKIINDLHKRAEDILRSLKVPETRLKEYLI